MLATMKQHGRKHSPLAVLAIALTTCAPDNPQRGDDITASPVEQTFRQVCDLACSRSALRWGCPVPASCISDCMATTAGLEKLCGLCVASTTFLRDNGDGSCSTRPGVANTYECEDSCMREGHQPRPDFGAECEIDCRIEGEDYGCAVPPNCVPDCMTITFGLETLCGKCVAETANLNRNADGTCEANPGDSDGTICGPFCVPGTHNVLPDFRAECEVDCRLQSEDFGCPMPPSCIDDCVAITQGLETGCGKCVARDNNLDDAGDGLCRSEPGSADRYPCDEVCAH